MLKVLDDETVEKINSAIQNAAMLSVAVDNAKDLSLGKINAGPAMLGMYAYGITLGIDVVTLAKIINSPQGRAISKAPSGKAYLEIAKRVLGEKIEVTIPGREKGFFARLKRLFTK